MCVIGFQHIYEHFMVELKLWWRGDRMGSGTFFRCATGVTSELYSGVDVVPLLLLGLEPRHLYVCVQASCAIDE